MLARVEYSVTVPVTVDAAFQAFQDLERLLNRGIYDEVLWIESTPWQVGSRLRYFVVRPVRATASAVVTSVESDRARSACSITALALPANRTCLSIPISMEARASA